MARREQYANIGYIGFHFWRRSFEQPRDLLRVQDLDMRYQSARDLLIDLKNLHRDLDIQGEIERSIIPNREATTGAIGESETRFYSTDSAAATGSGQVIPTQNVKSSSSLEYAVTQAKSHKLATAIVGLVLLAVVSTVGYFAFVSRRSGAGQINSIAVLPFENKSGNPDSEYLSDGLTESLIYRLSQLPNLKVSPTSSVLRYKGKEIDAQKVATELGVNAVLSGRMIQRGDNLTISVELVDAANNKILWGEQYERKMSDLLATQREIATTITDKLQLRLSGSESTGITKKYTSSNEAYQLYLKGRYNWNKRTVDGIQKAAEYYKQAIDKDPSFALAYAGMAESYVLFSAYSVGLPQDSMPQAKAAALKAIELDGSLAERHAVLGAYLTGYGWNFEPGERELRKATELNPNYATAYHWLGNILPVLGKNDEAIKAARRAEELDPLSTIISADTAFDLTLMHRYDDAIAQAQHTLTIDPNFYYAHYILGRVYNLKGMHSEAVAELRKTVELNPDPIAKGMLAQSLAKSGQQAEAVKLIDELKAESGRRYIPGYFLATAYLALGDKDAAIAMIEKDVRERGTYVQWITIDPELDSLRSDPRFVALLEKVKSSKLD
ncbi:MAG TPA: tetratricopeptide repeat protein [Pyrinomonadaceae bacterium]|nr:tetratricopeptide repeat protein [Pyrinomonadaceae bacterium]